MSVQRLRQVFVVAPDLEGQVHFYRDVLGLQEQFRDGDRWVQFKAGDVSVALASPEEGLGAPAGVPVPVFEVIDLDADLIELSAAGHAVLARRDMGGHGRTAMVRDPAGVHLVLFQRA